jgi:hypothetical protein
MLDWLVSIQLPGGGFQGGTVDATPVVPVTFNTGQILIGLARGADLDETYAGAMHQAANWLVESQDADGCWRKHPTPFAKPGEKTYETHVAWGLFEAARASGDGRYGEAGCNNVLWALTRQKSNGWFEDCCLTDPACPLTHTLGYVLRGVWEAYRYSKDQVFLIAAEKTAAGLASALREDGFLPGRLDSNWRQAAPWACLTGTVQVAYCWMALYLETGKETFRDAAFAANRWVRRTMDISGPEEIRGGIKGSFPVSGDYGRYQYLNWAAKFFIDSNRLESFIRSADRGQASVSG